MGSISSETIRSEFGVRLSRVGFAWRQQIDIEFKQRGGLTASKWRPLFMLGRLGDGVRQKDLAAALSIEGPSLVRLLDDLETHRLIERRADLGDRRAKTIHLTPEGWDAYRSLKEITGKFAAHFLDGISDEEFQICIGVLDRIEARLNSANEAEAA
ncbi:MarR family winged helix-turn-helix transcriptional regulator [Rhodoblastus sp.]|uniref:MarR family winged helix-turn-helix transcriptional regulator n=1 Tax=Rhodoblastus sp. TaxID=1962975 RepID=UPI003F9E2F8D